MNPSTTPAPARLWLLCTVAVIYVVWLGYLGLVALVG